MAPFPVPSRDPMVQALAGVTVRPGDLIMGDANGVLVIPAAHSAELLTLAQEFAATEERVKGAISQGAIPSRRTSVSITTA